MWSRLWVGARRRLSPRTLQAKILWPLIGLMVLSLLGSTLAFAIGTAWTRNQLVADQVSADAGQVTAVLNTRVGAVASAARLLANDPMILPVIDIDTVETMGQINSRAVVVRDRFDLHLVQISNRQGEGRVNLVVSSLYRETALFKYIRAGESLVRWVDGRLLFLCRADMPDGVGSVIVGLDMADELNHLAQTYRLSTDLGMTVGSNSVGVEVEQGRRDRYVRQVSMTLGQTPVELTLVRSTADTVRVTQAGLLIMIFSTLMTLAMLTGLGMLLTRSLARPVHTLAIAAEKLARGNLNCRVSLPVSNRLLAIGRDDEIGVLAATFNHMIGELSILYDHLEDKVRERTQALTIASQIARAISASLDLDQILQLSTRLIQERLDLYHVALFLIDAEADALVMRAAAGQEGIWRMERQFTIPCASGSIIGQAAAGYEPAIIQDISARPGLFDQAILLQARSAAAVPLMLGREAIGVLDVQSVTADVFTPDRVHLLTALADQIAIGIHNARLYAVQREMAEHLTEMDRVKNQFLTVISHELRTPLNSILGFSKLMLKGVNGLLNDTQQQDMQMIYQSGQHLMSLINDLLDLSKINAGKMEFNPEPVDVAILIRDVLGASQVLIQDRSIVLESVTDPDLPIIDADQRRLRQILLNLVSNAIKFTPRGRVVVRACRLDAVAPGMEQVSSFIQISVSDTGIGIPSAKLDAIFEEFTQVDDSASRRYQGAGLGLPITKKLVEMHGGQIWVESKVGQGSTFTFTLPVVQSTWPWMENSQKESSYA